MKRIMHFLFITHMLILGRGVEMGIIKKEGNKVSEKEPDSKNNGLRI